MKKVVLIMLLCLPSFAFATSAKEGRIGVGYQSMWPASGFAAKYDLDKLMTAQAVVGFWGSFSTYAVRGIYRLPKYEYPVYAFGTLAMYQYNSYLGPSNTFTGIGGGAGLEYNWQDFVDAKVPPIFWNLELGFMTAGSSLGGAGGIFLGVGATYYLDRSK